MQYSAAFAYALYAASVAMAVPVDVEKRQFGGLGGGSGGSTRNELVDGKCSDVTFIFARGSTEPGNFGSSVGPSIASALTSALGADGVTIQGVDYEATIASNAQQGRGGGPVMADLVAQAKSNCPGTKIALGGYSQGGFVVSNAISSSGVNGDDIIAAVLYGDPSRNAAGGLDPSKVKDYCTSGDGVCAGTFAISAAHLAYTSNGMTDEGAAFIVSQAGSASGSGSTGASTGGSDTSSGGEASGTGSTGGSSGSSFLDRFRSGGSSSFFGSGSGSSSGSSSGLGKWFGGKN